MKIGIVGDSLISGVGWGGSFGYQNSSWQCGGAKLWVCEMIRQELGYVQPRNNKGYGEDNFYLPRHELTGVVDETYDINVTTGKLTIYYLIEGNNTNTLDFTLNGVKTYTLSANMPLQSPDTDTGGSGKNVAKATYTVGNGVSTINFNNLVGTSFSIAGFCDGEGIEYYDISVGSTTLLNNSTANQSRGITTVERINKMITYNPDFIVVGWGTNDSKEGVRSPGQLGVDEFKADFKALVYDPIIANNPEAQFILMTAPIGLGVYANNILYSQGIRELSKQYNTLLFDVEVGNYDKVDDVHLTQSGYFDEQKDMLNSLMIVENTSKQTINVQQSYGVQLDGLLGTSINTNDFHPATIDYFNFHINVKDIIYAPANYILDNSPGALGYFLRTQGASIIRLAIYLEPSGLNLIDFPVTLSDIKSISIRHSKEFGTNLYINKVLVSEFGTALPIKITNTSDLIGKPVDSSTGGVAKYTGFVKSYDNLTDAQFNDFCSMRLPKDVDFNYVYYFGCAENGGEIAYNLLGADGNYVNGCTPYLNLDSSLLLNWNNGFDLWQKDSDSSFLRVPFDYNGISKKTNGDLISGYTWICSSPSGNNIWNRSEQKYNLPIYGLLTVDEILAHTDLGVKIFCEIVKDGNGTIIGIKNLLIYSVAPTGDCYNKTIKFLKLDYLKDINNEPILDSNNEYIVPAEVWQ